MSQLIQEIESRRTIGRRAERSSLDSESQQIQEAADLIVCRSYGLSPDDIRYMRERLEEML
jgi:hypothetical protein